MAKKVFIVSSSIEVSTGQNLTGTVFIPKLHNNGIEVNGKVDIDYDVYVATDKINGYEPMRYRVNGKKIDGINQFQLTQNESDNFGIGNYPDIVKRAMNVTFGVNTNDITVDEI